MTTISDPDASTGARCPQWCELPDDHDLPVMSGRATTARREHQLTLVDDDTLGHVTARRVDDLLCPNGPELVGRVMVEIQDLPNPLDRADYDALVNELVRAQGRLDEMWTEPAARGGDTDDTTAAGGAR